MQRARELLFSLPVLLWAVVAAAWSPALAGAAAAGDFPRPARVLVLHSFSPGSARTNGLDSGFNRVLSESGLDVHVLEEFLDAYDLSGTPRYPVFLDAKRTALAEVLSVGKPDAVLLTDRVALDFWLAHREDLAPDAPIIYCGVGESLPGALRGGNTVTGVIERPGFGDTVGEALRLVPKATKLLVLGDPRLYHQELGDMLEKDVSAFSGRLEIEYFQDQDIAAIEKKVRGLGPEWLVLAVGRPTEEGRPMLQSKASARVATASPVPVFATWKSWVGYGPVGGKVVDPVGQGLAAGRMAVEILRGEPAGDLPPLVLSGGRFIFDHAALARFGLDEALLPAGSILLNKPESFYEAHRMLVLHYGLVTALLAVATAWLALHTVSKRRMRDQLAAHVNFIESLMEAMPTPVFYKDIRGVYQGCNKAFENFMGKSREELVGRTVHDVYAPEEAEVFKRRDDALFAAGPVQFYEFEKSTSAGPRRIMFHKALYHDGQGRVAGLVGVIADITALRTAEKEVEKARNYLRAIIDSSPSALFCVDEAGMITHANANALELLHGSGPGSILPATLPGLDDLLEHVRFSIAEGRPVTQPRRLAQDLGEIKALDVMIYSLHAFGFREAVVRVDDATEQQRTQELLAQSEKMMSLGGLAAGMAHEINNPLGGIMQSAQVILARIQPEVPANRKAADRAGCAMENIQAYLRERDIPELLDGLRHSAKRAAEIVSNMIEFSRRSESAWLPVDVNALVDKAVELCLQDYNLPLSYDFRKIAITREYDLDNPRVPCSAQQIQHVVFNILQNAAQAMFQAGTASPAITLRTRRERGYMVVEVQDNGPGMDENLKRKIFEPFFTTKSPGQGTGLGLSVSYFIVHENHGGEIEVESWPGMGTRFLVKLPLEGKRNR